MSQAFPRPQNGHQGMELRDYFAAAIQMDLDGAELAQELKEALVGMPCPNYDESPLGYLRFEADFRAAWRGMQADAMIAERNKRED
jgi:hypothetical protein